MPIADRIETARRYRSQRAAVLRIGRFCRVAAGNPCRLRRVLA
jgi:hypothetical protein